MLQVRAGVSLCCFGLLSKSAHRVRWLIQKKMLLPNQARGQHLRRRSDSASSNDA